MVVNFLGDMVFALDEIGMIPTKMFAQCATPFLFEPVNVECRTLAAFCLEDDAITFANNLKTSDEVLAYILATDPSFTLYTLIPSDSTIEIFVGTCMSGFSANMCLHVITNTYADYDFVSVYINPEVRDFTEIVEYLVDNNFGDPVRVNNSRLTSTAVRQSISLTLDKDKMESTASDHDILQEALVLRGPYMHTSMTCMYKVFVPLAALNETREYLGKSTEYAGLFVIKSYTLEKTKDGSYIPVAELAYALDTETAGEFEVVSPPMGMFNFHTHPYQCYVKYGCTVGWPSDADLSAVTYFRDISGGTNMMHFVITMEGVYSMQLTPEFGRYLDTLKQSNFMNYSDCHALFISKIREMFNYMNALRTQASGPVYEFINYINSVKISYITSDRTIEESDRACTWIHPLSDFNLYNITFSPWDSIERDGGVSVTVESTGGALACPPSIATEIGKIGPKGLV